MTAAFSAWCVVATVAGIEARAVPYGSLQLPLVLAIYGSRQEAEQAATRAILMREMAEQEYAEIFDRERAVRAAAEPGSTAWADSVTHEIAILNKIAAAVRDAAQPREKQA
jgi:hypothetical protein